MLANELQYSPTPPPPPTPLSPSLSGCFSFPIDFSVFFFVVADIWYMIPSCGVLKLLVHINFVVFLSALFILRCSLVSGEFFFCVR